MKLSFLKWIVTAGLAGLLALPAAASVVITGTRVIYPADAREVTVKLNNNGSAPALVQAWIDDGDANFDAQQRPMPFTLTPPVFRIDPAKGQMLRVAHTHEQLPGDRESVYWLNVLEIPPKAADLQNQNVLQMAFRSRIKLFFRPAGLKGQANDAPGQVTWSLTHAASDSSGPVVLLASNPTPYHVSVSSASVQIGGQTYESAPAMIEPFGQHAFALKDLHEIPEEPPSVQFQTINDYGASTPGTFIPASR